MTSKTTIFTLFILVVIAWLFWQNKQDEIKPIQSVNQSVVNLSDNTQKKDTIKPKIIETEPEPIIDEIDNQSSINQLKGLSYMQLYEKYLDAQDCFGFYLLTDRSEYGLVPDDKTVKIDYIQEYKDAISGHSNHRQQQATEKQIQYYQDYANHCSDLKSEIEHSTDATENEKESFSFTADQIKLTMAETSPITGEEKQLKLTIKQAQKYNDLRWKIEELQSGKSDLSEQESDKFKRDILDLEFQLNSSDFYGDQAKLTPEYLSLKKQFDEKKAYLKSHITIDQKELNHQKNLLINSMVILDSQLNTPYSSVFVEAFNALNFNYNEENKLPHYYLLKKLYKSGEQTRVISQQIFDELAFKDKAYFNQLLQPSLEMYQCYLGANCTFPNNRRLNYLCYLPRNYFQNKRTGLFYESCDMNLEEFYLQNYLTENQVEDMNLIFNYLVSNYAN